MNKSTLDSSLTLANNVIAFVLEVALLVAAFFWAYKTFSAPTGLITGLLLDIAIVVFWTFLMAPKSRFRIRWPAQPLVALVLFLLAGLGLILAQAGLLGILMIIVAVANAALSYWLKWKNGTASNPDK